MRIGRKSKVGIIEDAMGKRNQGFTFVELILVIAILSVVAAVAILSVNLIYEADAKACANGIVSALSECQMVTMSKDQGNVRLVFYRDSDGSLYSELQTKESEDALWTVERESARRIGAERCSVGSTDGGDDLPNRTDALSFDLADGLWEIYYDRSTGSLTDDTTVSDIYICGGGRNYHIHLEKLTGKPVVEQY